jgi:flagellar biosynthesis chaperone FliJ
MKKNHDRGMKAVARVREVRERDSRIGLLQALDGVREREARLEELNRALEEAQSFKSGTAGGFVAARAMLTSMAHEVRLAEQRLESARTVATEAHHRWQADKARLRAIRHLIQERALERVEHARRAEIREVDDIVGSLHARRSALGTQDKELAS